MRKQRRVLLVVPGVLALLMLLAGPAAAHVELSAASPEEGETVTEALSEVRLEFSGPLQAGGDHAVGLFDPAGERVDDGGTVEVSDRVLTVEVGPLEDAGEYTVQHLVIAADGHPYEGSYTFTYDGPLAEPATPDPDPTPEKTEDTSPAEPTEPAGDAAGDAEGDAEETAVVEETGGFPLALVVGIIAVVGIAAGLLVARKRGAEGGPES